jgi:glutamate-ammonia-ligase adenylyltransferase
MLRGGFVDSDRGAAAFERLAGWCDPLLPILARTADPDLAVEKLADLAEKIGGTGGGGAAGTREEFLETLVEDGGSAMRLLSVLGASRALGEHLLRHPEHWLEVTDPTLGSTRPAAYAMRASLLRAVCADPEAATPVSTLGDSESLDALRVEYRRLLLRLAARDLAHGLGMDDVAAELSDLAAGTLEAALAVARARVGETSTCCRLAVIAMGKCGGHELNYVSDVDVIFVAEPAVGDTGDGDEQVALRTASQLATQLMRVCSDHTAEGTIWPVDAGLRPEGRSGPLVRTLASHQGYYERWAKPWEFQALLKARPVAGDLALGRDFVELVDPMIWRVAEQEGFVPAVQAMRRRVIEHIPSKEAERQLKLGVGGLRDVEFAVQLLQLVHGRGDERLRVPTTLSALAELTRGGYVGREDGAALHDAYSFLRTLEHRLQLFALRRTHLVPETDEDLRRLARSLGFLKKPVEELDKALAEQRREVRRLHEKLFYRPLLDTVAKISGQAIRLSPQAAETRMAALGYHDPKAALRHLEALTAGVSRRAAIQRTLLPAMLEWFAESPDPDAGLFGFRRISEALGRTPWYLRMLRDEGEVAERMARVLSASRFATTLLETEPAGVRLLTTEELRPRERSSLEVEMLAAGGRQDTRASAISQVRAVRRRELLRVAAADLSDLVSIDQVGEALTATTCATLEAALAIGVRAVEFETDRPLPTRMAVVSMGRLGGHEVGYGSDADVMFVHQPLPDADPQAAGRAAQAVALEMRKLLALPGGDPALEVDAGLRPEGKQGALVRTLDSYAAYYAKWSAAWEAQALLRAEAVVGDRELCARFTELIDPLRYPEGGIPPSDVREVRRIKARVDDERLPRGADPATHLKLGRGGLADIEWTVQLLQMRHAGDDPSLRTTRTLEALERLHEAGHLSFEEARTLADTWRLVSRIRNAITLVRGRAADQLPRDVREMTAIAFALGYPSGTSDELTNDYLKASRRARMVVDEVFWEDRRPPQ